MSARIRRCGSVLLVMLVVMMLSITLPPRGASADMQAARDPQASGLLNGLVFVGKIGLVGKLNLDDELHFAAGQFWSQNCIACGYRRGAYWTRRVADAIHFQGVLQSDDRGTLTYSGRIRDGRAEVDIQWTQRRWYWSIERDLAFVGTLVEPTTTDSPAGHAAAAVADPQQQTPRPCRSIL